MEAVKVYEAHDMTLVGRPADILAEAKEAADRLMEVVQKAGLAINFGGKKDHIEFEAWQTVGKFYGMTVKCVDTRFVTYGTAQGFESTSVVIDRYGNEISRAEAMCLNDEDKWKSKSKYSYLYVLKDGTKQEGEPEDKKQIEWVPNPKKPGKNMPNKERVKVGDEAVPLFQLKSMAQTRSNAKALRNVLAWVVVLAGFSPTPAEEVITEEETLEQETEKKQSKTSTVKPGNGTTETKTDPGKTLTAAETLRKELSEYCGKDETKMADILKGITFFEGEDKKQVFMTLDGIDKAKSGWLGKTISALRKYVTEHPIEAVCNPDECGQSTMRGEAIFCEKDQKNCRQVP